MLMMREGGFLLSLVLLLQGWLAVSLDQLEWLTLRTERARTLGSAISYKHLVTSSTLSWARIEDVLSGRIPSSLVVLVEDSAVCRVRDGSRQRAGRTDLSGSCLAGPGWVKHTNYQVLVNPTKLSRFEWRYWDMYRHPELGTLAFNDDTFVANFQLDSGRKIIGELDFDRGLNGNIKAYVSENNTQLSTQGSALVEIEPIQYILEDVQLNTEREKKKSETVQLGQVSLSRNLSVEVDEEDDWEMVEDAIPYSRQISQYWGHIPGTIKGLPAQIESRDFYWGMEWQGAESGVWQVQEYLLPGTSTLVQLQGDVRSGSVPFTAKLVQVYKDGKKTRTPIHGNLVETSLDNVRQVADPPVYTEDGSLAPTRPTTSTTTTTTTTPSTNSPAQQAGHTDGAMFAQGEASEDAAMVNDSGVGHVSKEVGGLPTRHSTMFPPTQPTKTTENPLRKFYPIEEEDDPNELIMAPKMGEQDRLVNGGWRETEVAMLTWILPFLAISLVQITHYL